MPIPKPNSGESQDNYISRCMSAQSEENKPQEQKLAICYSTWRDSKKSLLMNAVNKIISIFKGKISG